jgi:DNA-binding transcriptional LysR family regulator
MSEIERTFSMRSRFDPSQTKRNFRLFATDYGVNVIGPTLVDALEAAAPQATLEFSPISSQLSTSVDQLRGYDGMLLPLGFLGDDTPHTTLYTDRWVILAGKHNPIADEELSPESLAKLDWVIPFQDIGAARLPPVRQLSLRGIEIHTSVIASNFGAMPALVRGSNRVAFIQERLAQCLGAIDEFSIVECPFDVVPLNEAMYWHSSLSADPGHIWLRGIVEGVGAKLRKRNPS